MNHVEGKVYDAGPLRFQKAAEQDLRKVQFKVLGAKPEEKRSKIECALILVNKCYLWDDEGYEGSSNPWVTAERKSVDFGNLVEFTGLSNLPYQLSIKSEGFVSQMLELSLEEGDIELGEIDLLAAPRLNFEYRVRVRQNGGGWKGKGESQKQSVVCDGNNTLSFSKESDGLGNALGLRLKPKREQVEASFFSYQGKSFVELGPWEGKKFPTWKEAEVARKQQGRPKILLKSRSLYYFSVDDINGTEIQMMFAVN